MDALRQICAPYESRPFDRIRMLIDKCISLKEAKGVPTLDLFCVKGLRSDGSIEKFELCHIYRGKVVPLDTRPRITFGSPPPPRTLALTRYEYDYPPVRRLSRFVFESLPMFVFQPLPMVLYRLPLSVVIDKQQRIRRRKREKKLVNIKRTNLVNRRRYRRHQR